MPHPLFTISASEVQLLNDEQARELVARLCNAEANKLGAIKPSVTWGGDQRAKDGGIDVRFDAHDLPSPSTYLPSKSTGFQVKAEKFPPSKIEPEMAKEGILSNSIVELGTHAGAYVIVSTKDSVSDSALKARKIAIADCLGTANLAESVLFDFFDSRRVADWVEQYPSIVTWVKNAIGCPQIGWRPYGPWAYREQDADAEYVLDDKVKVFVPNADEGSNISSAINTLRSDLSSRAIVRLVGLSGVGKTRLVQALFDSRIVTEANALSSDDVIYADLSDQVDPQPTAMIEALLDGETDTCVVVDNCGQDLHKRLSEIVARHGARVSLITIEYDIRDDLPEGTNCYRLEGSSDAVIKELLQRRYSHLSSTDIDRVTDFSDGNARVAFALASASGRRDELAQLADDDLFRRLFHQKQVESDELLRCAEVTSLLYSFDGECVDETSELTLLASITDISTTTLYRHIAELQRRGLVQQRGKWRAVLPHAIANRLAARALANYPPAVLVAVLLDNASDRVAKSFSRRLGYLHGSSDARRIVGDFLKPNGRLDKLETLNDLGRQILKNVAPVDPRAALGSLTRAVTRADVLRLDGYVASDLVRIARSLAYDADMFDEALHVLRAFAQPQSHDAGSNSSHEAISTLFYCHLSGTHASPEKRVDTILALLRSAERLDRDLGLQALAKALETDHFSSYFEFEFGSHKRDYGWAPKTSSDVGRWYEGFIFAALEVALQGGKIGHEIRQLLGRSFRGLSQNAGMLSQLETVSQKLVDDGGWPEGWVGIRETLYWNNKTIPADAFRRLKELEQLLAPRDLIGQIRSHVLSRGASAIDFLGDDDGDVLAGYRKAQTQAEKLGKLAANNPGAVSAILPDLLGDQSSENSYHFGLGLGLGLTDPTYILADMRKIIASREAHELNLIPVRGLLNKWSCACPEAAGAFLDHAVTDDVWGPWLPELQCAVGLEGKGIDRVMHSLDVGLAPDFQYRYLSMGRATEPLNSEAIAKLVRRISTHPSRVAVSIDILGMVIHSAHERGEQFVREIARVARDFLAEVDFTSLNTNDTMVDHHLEQLLTFVLSKNEPSPKDRAVLDNLLSWENSERRIYAFGRGRHLKPFFKFRSEMVLDAIYQPDKKGSYRSARDFAASRDNDPENRPMASLPTDVALRWCALSPTDRFPFVAKTCPLYAPGSEGVDFRRELTRDWAVFPLRSDPCLNPPLLADCRGHWSDRHGVTERYPALASAG